MIDKSSIVQLKFMIVIVVSLNFLYHFIVFMLLPYAK